MKPSFCHRQCRLQGLRRQQGIGLVELMLGLVLGLFITGMALQYFLTIRATATTQEALSYLQESARHVSHRLQPVMRNIGFSGCTPWSSVSDNTGTHAQPLAVKSVTEDGVSYDRLAMQIPALALTDDGQRGWQLSSAAAQGDRSIEVKSYSGEQLSSGSYVMISDCESGDIDTVSGSEDGKLSLSSGLQYGYGGNQQTRPFVYPFERWYLVMLASTSDNPQRLCLSSDNASGDGPEAGCAEELASYVNEIQLRFDLAVGGGYAVDQTASQVAGRWDQVRRIHLDLALSTPPSLQIEGEAGGTMQRTFSMTFSPRNLGL
ncbi:PilW family protein [Cobetia sp. Ld8]|uniref:PilW family protein n=1 Tax=Cobetia sp. Ld8 TaxID=649154 RepID=UPI00386E81F8